MSHIDVKSQHLGLVVLSDSGISTRARTHRSDFTNNSINHTIKFERFIPEIIFYQDAWLIVLYFRLFGF